MIFEEFFIQKINYLGIYFSLSDDIIINKWGNSYEIKCDKKIICRVTKELYDEIKEEYRKLEYKKEYKELYDKIKEEYEEKLNREKHREVIRKSIELLEELGENNNLLEEIDFIIKKLKEKL